MPIDLATFYQRATAPRAARTTRTANSTPRAPSVAARCLAWLEAAVEEQNAHGHAFFLNDIVTAWCAEHYPAEPGRLTPAATVESQIRTLFKAGALPQHIHILSAKLNLADGRAGRATITVEAE